MTFIMVTSMMFFASVCQACPSCAADDGGDASSLVVLAGMIIMPMLVAAVTIPMVLRLVKSETQTNLPDFVMYEKGSGS
jgi:undecaprenyl pyrophosphate phosphatase UppP